MKRQFKYSDPILAAWDALQERIGPPRMPPGMQRLLLIRDRYAGPATDEEVRAAIRGGPFRAAPASTNLGAPAGIAFEDGFSTAFVYSLLPTASFWEVSAKPAGLDGGEPIPTKNMRRTLWRTFAPPTLMELKPATAKVMYDPNIRFQALSLINVRKSAGNVAQAITEWYPDKSHYSYYGYMKDFIFDDHEEDKLATAMMTIMPTNWDPINHVEAGPVYVDVPGT